MSDPVAEAILRQLGVTFGVCIKTIYLPNPLESKDMWTITAESDSGETWTSRHEDHYKAACGLAELMGFEMEDGLFGE